MDTLIQAVSLIDTNSITFVVYAWAALCTAVLVAMPALTSWDMGLDYHNLNVLDDKDLEREFFGFTLEDVQEALEVVTSLHNRLAKKAIIFTVPAHIAALPTQEEVDMQEAPAIPERWASEVVTEEITWESLFENKEDDLDELWDRIDATKYAPITFGQYMRTA
jgi:hypothetical protein